MCACFLPTAFLEIPRSLCHLIAQRLHQNGDIGAAHLQQSADESISAGQVRLVADIVWKKRLDECTSSLEWKGLGKPFLAALHLVFVH